MKHEPPRTTEQVAAGTPPPPPPADPNPTVIEEAGSRALTEALRSSFVIVKILMVGLVVLFFASGIFTVPSQQRAMILRFGKPMGLGPAQLIGPGLHFSFPAPIDEVVRIPVGELQSARSTAGWFQTTAESEASGQDEKDTGNMTLNPAVDGYTITGDGNIIHARATISYRITDPLNYVLNFVKAPTLVTNAIDNALFYVSSFFTVDRAIRYDQAVFHDMLLQRVKDIVNEEKLGITVVSCDELKLIAPRQVRKDFEAVTTAEIERRKARDEAQAYASSNLTTANGIAAAIVNQGRIDANRFAQEASADAKYFQDLLPHYLENPELFRARLQAEAMGRVLTNVQTAFVIPTSTEGQEPQLRLLLNPPPRRSQINEPIR
ncbi:MAG TPA: protease modulator HflK [Verrucomicrobiae bacterium]|jgi:membrane protease subunit HflK|nr:protease modulator HflK [Verrucomicrobiae bacterium]